MRNWLDTSTLDVGSSMFKVKFLNSWYWSIGFFPSAACDSGETAQQFFQVDKSKA